MIAALLMGTLAFIWGNSLKSIPDSRAGSKRVMEVIKPALDTIVGEGNVMNHLVRKMAHFMEFFALGCGLMVLSLLRRRRSSRKAVGLCLLAGLAVAATDETIQIFSNRGSQLRDVWLDFAGACAGVVFVLLVYWIVILVARRWKGKQAE